VLAGCLAPLLDADVASLDDINEARGLFGGEGVPVDQWVITHQLAAEQVRQKLAAGRVVIVDDTSSPRFLRDAWRSHAADMDASFALVFVDTAVEVIMERHKANRSTAERNDVTDAILRDHLAGFEPPDADEAAIRVSITDQPSAVAAKVLHALAR
jgi:predicted kinase